MMKRSIPQILARASRRELETLYALLNAALVDLPPSSAEYDYIAGLLDKVERLLSGPAPCAFYRP
jgi:hypothetical protein